MLLWLTVNILPGNSAHAQSAHLEVLDANGTPVGVVSGAAGYTSPVVALTANGVTFGLRVRQAALDGNTDRLYFVSGDCTGPPPFHVAVVTNGSPPPSPEMCGGKHCPSSK